MRRASLIVAAALCIAATAAGARVLSGGASSLPPGASSAGYTTQALNDDFTQTMPSNWLGGCATPGNGAANSPSSSDDGGPHHWWQNIWWMTGYQPCNVSQVTDPTYGGTVLDLPWVVDNTSNSTDIIGNTLESASWDYNPSTNTGQARTYSNGSYYEVVARIDPPTLQGNYFAFWTWGERGISNQSQSGTEWDIVETNGENLGSYDSAIHNYSGNGGGWVLFPWTSLASGTNFDATKYNTYGLQVTYDGSIGIGCTYVNNVLQKCAPWGGVITADEQAQRSFLLLTTACNNSVAACTSGAQEHSYIKSARVWSCSNWATTQCPVTFNYGSNLLTGSFTSYQLTQSAATAPDGSAATRMTESTANDYHEVDQAISTSAALFHKFSCNIAPGSGGSSRYLWIGLNDGTTYYSTTIDPSTGTIQGTSNAGVVVTPLSPSGYNVTITSSGIVPTDVTLALSKPGTGTSYTGDGTSNVLFWGCQAKAGNL